jgi:hypothetical protein
VHAPVLPHGALVEVAHIPWGSVAPAPTNVHVPGLLATLQAWQSGHALAVVLQQTPSMHLPTPHGLLALHELPIPPPLTQCAGLVLVSHVLPVAQFTLGAVHEVLHPVLLQV